MKYFLTIFALFLKIYLCLGQLLQVNFIMGKKNAELSDKKRIKEHQKNITNLQFKEAVCCKKLAELNTKEPYNGYTNLKALLKFKEAVELFIEAADQGHAEAQNSLATCYYNGQGVTKSFNRAVQWWTKAAMQGNVQAQCSLAGCYDCGTIGRAIFMTYVKMKNDCYQISESSKIRNYNDVCKGFNLSKKLTKKYNVIGIDNLKENNYSKLSSDRIKDFVTRGN